MYTHSRVYLCKDFLCVYIYRFLFKKMSRDFSQKQHISIPNNKLHGFSFNITPSIIMNYSITFCHASMHIWKASTWIPLRSPITCPLDDIHTFKISTLDDFLGSEEKKKLQRVRSYKKRQFV